MRVLKSLAVIGAIGIWAATPASAARCSGVCAFGGPEIETGMAVQGSTAGGGAGGFTTSTGGPHVGVWIDFNTAYVPTADPSGVAALTAGTAVPAAPNATTPVPEPALWLQFITGFGLAGAALRTVRRHKIAVCAS